MDKTDYSYVRLGANLGFAGTLLSGPVGLIVVNSTYPQPKWAGPDVFLQNYHSIQVVPYLLGMLLLVGSMLIAAGAINLMPPRQKPLGILGFSLVALAATLIFLNYIIQVSFLPHQTLDNGQIISALSMSNPSSLAWSIEMWGYGLMGIGLWLLTPAFHREGRDRLIRVLLGINAILGVIGAIATAWIAAWPLSIAGMISFVVWNLAYLFLLYRLRSPSSP